MITFIIFLLVIVSILMVLVVLAQDSKGGIAGQSSATQLMGVKRTGDLLERLTWGFAIGIMVLCVASGFVMTSEDGEVPTSVNIEEAANARPSAPAPAPTDTTAPAAAPADTAK